MLFFYVLGWFIICTHDFLDVLSRDSPQNQFGSALTAMMSTFVSLFLRKLFLWLFPNFVTHALFCVLVVHATVRLGLQMVRHYDTSAAKRLPKFTVRFPHAMLSPWRHSHKSTLQLKLDNANGKKTAALDQADAARLALLISSCYERAMSHRRSGYGKEITSISFRNAADGPGDDTCDAASRKRRELLGLFYALASSQLARPDSEGTSSSSLVTANSCVENTATRGCDGEAPLALATSIHDLVVSASTPQGLELALSARTSLASMHKLPSYHGEPRLPEPSRSCSSLPEDDMSQTTALDEITRDRDLYRTRAYQLAFKVDDLHNRHSQTLCALERSEVIVEVLQSHNRDLVVALASLFLATSSGVQAAPSTSSSLSSVAFAPTSVSVQGDVALYGVGDAKVDPLQPQSDFLQTLASAEDVILYPRGPAKSPNPPATALELTQQLLIPVTDVAGPLARSGELDGSWRKRMSVRAPSPGKTKNQDEHLAVELSASASGQAPWVTESLLGKSHAGNPADTMKPFRPLPSSWLPSASAAGLDCSLEPEDAADDDGQVTLPGSQADLNKGDVVSMRKGHDVQTHTMASDTTLGDDRPHSRRQSWVNTESASHCQYSGYSSFDSPSWRHDGQGTLDRSNSRESTTSLRTQRSTSSLNSLGSSSRPSMGRTRTSTGPVQMLSDASVNWRERSDGPDALNVNYDGGFTGEVDGASRFALSGRTTKSVSGRRSFGFGAGATRADELCRQNLNLHAPYFQGFQGFQGQGQGVPLRRSQSTIGSEARTASAAVEGDLHRRSSLAEKSREGSVTSVIVDNAWNRRAHERATATIGGTFGAQGATVVV